MVIMCRMSADSADPGLKAALDRYLRHHLGISLDAYLLDRRDDDRSYGWIAEAIARDTNGIFRPARQTVTRWVVEARQSEAAGQGAAS